jgi:acyl-CoA synthetase (AMP-forming)/AMP-acid ligase II
MSARVFLLVIPFRQDGNKRMNSDVGRDWTLDVPPATVADLLERAVARYGAQTAVVDAATGETLTFAELAAVAADIRDALAAKLPAGARIAVLAPPGPATLALHLGIQIGGRVAVLLNPLAAVAELAEVMRRSRVDAVIFARELRGFDVATVARAAAADLPASCLLVELAHDARSVAPAIGPASAGAPPAAAPAPSDLAQLPFTSGTTAAARGVLLSHRAVTLNGWANAAGMDVRTGDAWLSSLPQFHTAGSVLLNLGALAAGATQVSLPYFDPERYLDAMARYRVTHVGAVPTMLAAMLARPELSALDLSNLRGILSGGSLVPPELAERAEQAFGAQVLIVYGQTECAPALTLTLPADSVADRRTTVGRPLPIAEIQIRDGEICARSRTMMDGYDGMPELTAATLEADGWLHTGDLGELDERGYLKVTGRRKDIVIRGGENISPAEIEDTLRRVPGVADAAVLGVPDAYWGESVAAVLQPAQPALAEADRVALIEAARHFARALLAQHKVPAHWDVADEMPRTALGKVQKFLLRKRFETRGEAAKAR